MEKKLIQEIIDAAYKEDRNLYEKFEKVCPSHFGRICTDGGNKGILCRYDACPHRAIKGGKF